MKLENYSKGLFLISGILLILIGVPKLFLKSGVPYTTEVFFLSVLLFLLGVSFSYKVVLDFLSMRTTKYGLNMGSLIGLGLVLYFCLNFFAFRYDKSIDITGDKLNSLSLQSLEILDKLKDDVEFRVYYQGKTHLSQNLALKGVFKKYIRESSKVKTRFIDAHKDPRSSQYLKREDKGRLVIFVKQGERMERVKEPLSEESITSALFRLNQTDFKKIYFLTGHGERGLEKGKFGGTGISLLVEGLRSKGLGVSELNLLQVQSVPGDAAMVAVIGPQKALLEREILTLKDYIVDGGRMILASDPTQETNLHKLASFVGIENQRKLLLTNETLQGGDHMSVIGLRFNPTNPITVKLTEGSYGFFYESSALKKASSNFTVEPLVTTGRVIFPIENLKDYSKEIEGKSPEEAQIGMISKGSFEDSSHKGHDHGGEEPSDFLVAVFGDSDFMSNSYINNVFNKDLALNTFAELSGQTGLISIRPKTAKDTKLELTSARSTFVVIFPVLIPLLLLLTSAILWFRKRGA